MDRSTRATLSIYNTPIYISHFQSIYHYHWNSSGLHFKRTAAMTYNIHICYHIDVAMVSNTSIPARILI